MKAYTLEIEELAALVGFLNAKKLVGLDESLFRVFSEENIPRLVAKLNEHGWLTPAERPNTYHFEEDLMQTLAVAVAPEFAVLARSEAQSKSIVFYLAGTEITEIVITADRAVVARIESLDEMSAQVTAFLQGAWPGEIAVARVKGEAFDAGRRATIDAQGTLTTKTPGLLPGNTWSAENVAALLRGALAELRAPRG
ncbi:hypothetical protein [Polyangium sp. 15x6]|uniref:hypothetical protein n=1 Tax=Polyangium sp. 15x6 TaxID=3042687 RepID=UPI00249A33C8|nr:hypothetical protein [Polyangium sp. 15x6]MDI3284392.1 hypothetical protein [Polyangium sp. 15x6]